MEEKKRGGKRAGAGRKKLGSLKAIITLYVDKKVIWSFGSKEKLKRKLYEFISTAQPKT